MVSLSAHLLSHFLGKVSIATQAIPPAPLFYRCLQRDSAIKTMKLLCPYHNPPKKTLLVERTPFQMEWKDKSDQVTISSDASLLGRNSLCEELHGLCVVSSGTDNAHQLSGASSSKDLLASTAEQYHSSCLQQQHVRHSV